MIPAISCRIPRGMRGLKCTYWLLACADRTSHPSRDAWIEIYCAKDLRRNILQSHPSRDAWIEIIKQVTVGSLPDSRIPRGMRGLKSDLMPLMQESAGRIPRGMRGLKSIVISSVILHMSVASLAGCVD